MEKVQFQLEATLPELKDLHEKGLFTKHEIDQITRRRTAFETSLIRRQTRKDDFFKYAEYEINLEQLRKVRWKKMGYHINPPPPSASTYSLPRRTVYILKRATMKFPGDLAVWLAYVEFASRQGMRKVVIKGLTTALQHHPLSPTIYLLLSYHHLHPASPFPRDIIPSTSTLDLPSVNSQDTGFSLEGTAAARTQLLLGIRLLPRSTELWTEYIKLELGWVEALRRRWNVLGIADTIDAPANDSVNAEGMTGGEGSFGPDGEDARKSILSGQLVVHALDSALEAINGTEGLEFRLALLEMFRRYPSALRAKYLDAVYTDLEGIAKGEDESAAKAKLALMTKRMYDTVYVPGQADAPLEGVELVEGIGKIGKEIRKMAKDGKAFLQVAGRWLGEQVKTQENDDLRSYLLSIMTSLTAAKYDPPATLLVQHLTLIRQYDGASDVLKIARSHAALYPSNATLQRIRLEYEAEQRSSDLGNIFEGVVKAVSPVEEDDQEEDVRKIWFIWTSYEETQAAPSDIDATWTKILTLSSRINRPSIHTALLGRYFISTLQRPSPLPALRTIDSLAKYRPSEDVYAIALMAIAIYSQQPYHDLVKLYERWKSAARSKHGQIEAALAWAGWLLENKKAHEAAKIVDSVRREDEVEVERRWKEMCDDAEEKGQEKEGSEVERLERKLRVIGWTGLGTAKGALRPVEEDEEDEDDEDDDEDEEMDEGEDESEEDEEDEDEGMEINM